MLIEQGITDVVLFYLEAIILKLSTRGRYGVIAMLDLAIHYSEDIVSIKNIAERQNMSESYLEQLFAVLRKAGLVNSVRGSQGGYMLSDSPANITVGSILRSLEGSLAPVGCVTETEPDICSRYGSCVTKLVWEKVRNAIYDVVDFVTLENLVEEYKKQGEQENYMYYL